MCQAREHLGDLAKPHADPMRQLNLAAYVRWVEQARVQGKFKADLTTPCAALYIDTQISAAMRLQKQGDHRADIAAVLRAFLDFLVDRFAKVPW